MDSRTAFISHVTMVLICAAAVRYQYEFIIVQLVAGLVAIYSLRELSKRAQVFKTAILVTHDLSEAISLADHILVLSKAPSHIAFDCPLKFGISDLTPLDKRSQPEFQTYFNILWRHLHETDG